MKPRAIDHNLSSCHLCSKLAPAESHHCPLCGAAMHLRKSDSLNRTLSLLITACILYIPANILPMMITTFRGQSEPSTIIGGVILLIKLGSAPIAAVIFIASVIVPISKLTIMFYLCWYAKKSDHISSKQRTVLYRITELVGKWSFVDVYVVAILVALVNLQGLMVITPGIAAIAFAGVVIVTMIAAESFDPRLMWDNVEKNNE